MGWGGDNLDNLDVENWLLLTFLCLFVKIHPPFHPSLYPHTLQCDFTKLLIKNMMFILLILATWLPLWFTLKEGSKSLISSSEHRPQEVLYNSVLSLDLALPCEEAWASLLDDDTRVTHLLLLFQKTASHTSDMRMRPSFL